MVVVVVGLNTAPLAAPVLSGRLDVDSDALYINLVACAVRRAPCPVRRVLCAVCYASRHAVFQQQQQQHQQQQQQEPRFSRLILKETRTIALPVLELSTTPAVQLGSPERPKIAICPPRSVSTRLSYASPMPCDWLHVRVYIQSRYSALDSRPPDHTTSLTTSPGAYSLTHQHTLDTQGSS
ncbi:hypothetical protein E2C01_035109 [Portunus trituberculatus]|uniref:Uncharacterized protein n=1 Tax=Portunus trituberculatus TaxID=210409 RepID=A0A5B7FAK3_PORTR|nr:hypothetical protein [Portunus trituberculatus]